MLGIGTQVLTLPQRAFLPTEPRIPSLISGVFKPILRAEFLGYRAQMSLILPHVVQSASKVIVI